MPQPVNDNSITMGAQPDGDGTQLLLQFISSLYKKDMVQKPSLFYATSGNITSHIKSVEKYLKSVNIVDNMGKITVLLETLEQKVKNALIFESDYDANAEDFKWLKEKLIILFPSKENQTTALLDLFEVKQNGREISEFILDIKNNVALNQTIPKTRYDKVSLDIFLRGLDDRKLSQAVLLQEPKTLSSAVDIVMSVKKKSVEVNQIHQSADLSEQVKELQKQVAYLTQLVLAIKSQSQSRTPKEIPRVPEKRDFERNNTRFQRNNFSHNQRSQNNNFNKDNSWQEVRRKSNFNNRKCFKCGSFNHIQRNCNRNRQLNYLQPSDDLYSTSRAESIGADESIDVSNHVAVIQKTAVNVKQDRAAIIKSSVGSRLCPNFPSDILKMESFINDTTKPVTYASVAKANKCTAITTRPQRKSASNNKPLIKGRINDEPVSFFMDTGAEVNVIDSALLESMDVGQRNFVPFESKSIKCANNTKLEVRGKVVLPISIGVSTKNLTFLVVSGVNPRVIIGLRGLKTFGAEVFPQRDSIKCSGVEIPFIGKTDIDSCYQKNSKMVH